MQVKRRLAVTAVLACVVLGMALGWVYIAIGKCDVPAAVMKGELTTLRLVLLLKPHIIENRTDAGASLLYVALTESPAPIPMCEFLLDHGADTNRTLDTGLSVLLKVLLNDPQNRKVRLLVARGATVDWYSAAALGDLPRMQQFCRQNPNWLNGQVLNGGTALHFAVRSQQRKAVEWLLGHGADPNAKDQVGHTPLHLVPRWLGISDVGENLQMARLLLDHGADPNIVGPRGMTPLHSAYELSNAEYINVLLSHGADSCVKDADGRTPVDVATDLHRTQVLERLRQIVDAKQ